MGGTLGDDLVDFLFMWKDKFCTPLKQLIGRFNLLSSVELDTVAVTSFHHCTVGNFDQCGYGSDNDLLLGTSCKLTINCTFGGLMFILEFTSVHLDKGTELAKDGIVLII